VLAQEKKGKEKIVRGSVVMIGRKTEWGVVAI
jgi:hypothetical protein